jgi:hypothetical protein
LTNPKIHFTILYSYKRKKANYGDYKEKYINHSAADTAGYSTYSNMCFLRWNDSDVSLLSAVSAK